MIQNENNGGLINEINNFDNNSSKKRARNEEERREEIYNNASTTIEHFVFYDDGKGNFEKIKESNDPFVFKYYEKYK